jgi:hypothetical protein
MEFRWSLDGVEMEPAAHRSCRCRTGSACSGRRRPAESPPGSSRSRRTRRLLASCCCARRTPPHLHTRDQRNELAPGSNLDAESSCVRLGRLPSMSNGSDCFESISDCFESRERVVIHTRMRQLSSPSCAILRTSSLLLHRAVMGTFSMAIFRKTGTKGP